MTDLMCWSLQSFEPNSLMMTGAWAATGTIVESQHALWHSCPL